MELVRVSLKRKLPLELCGEIEGLAHDLAPVMSELLRKHGPPIPQMFISTKSIENVRHLIHRYKSDLHTVCFERKGGRAFYSVEVGSTSSLRKVRVYRYTREPRWLYRRSAWAEVGVLV